jgi:hypothetical protein
MPYRCMLRISFGEVGRSLTADEFATNGEKFKGLMQDWKKAGIRLIGTFGNSAHPGGYAHELLLEVNNYDAVGLIDRGLMREIKFESHQVDFGTAREWAEQGWDDA